MSAPELNLMPAATTNRAHQRLNPFRGMLRLWCFDIGSVSFLGTGLLGVILAGIAAANGKSDSVELLFSMGIVSSSAAVAWQLIRLMASECSQLIPHYRRHIYIQSLVVLACVFAIGVLCCLALELTSSLASLVLALVMSLAFIWLCLLSTQWFYASFLLFVLVPFISSIAAHIPLWLSMMTLVVFGGLIIRVCRALPWRAEARAVYLNGLEMGWFWLPNLQSMRILSRFERYLHPTNFFIGPMLTILLLLLPVVGIVLWILSHQFHWNFPVLQLLAQFSVISCGLVHWSRVQRSRSTETLLLMPGFDGRKGLIAAFCRGQQRLLNVVVGIVLVCTLLLSWLDGDLNIPLLGHLVLSTYWACALTLGFGSMCRRVWQITLTMMIVVAHSLWVSISLASLRDGGNLDDWFIWDFVLMLLGNLVLIWGKRTLWKGDVIHG
ncbi:ABC transporter permease [Shewanella sp. CG12_big_fil_rev_8_21_14_0_65_47_15]|uniref:ABC transporter permease n=1 Tax=Shewanella sp. CG12_big_fil_rev_8_21_14_0_65_47_15 TaxID=1975537 RepID=UPI000CBF11EF|nr:ABC transporter permease [Shewanella sp. CG12_big_fil_rev_8_21_14_0_65_47_15]PIW63122.1 MAG: ABC transporter permease [Shewanella sp. CG12_big_fil_rev_8_21_14_0_65_47_15]